MTRDLVVLQWWIQVCLTVAAVCATSFPVIWAFSRWWETLLGRLLMLQGVSFALAINLTLVFRTWPPTHHIELALITTAVVFGLIALSTSLLTATMIRMNYIRRKKKGTTNE